jgi:hypothetical protein
MKLQVLVDKLHVFPFRDSFFMLVIHDPHFGSATFLLSNDYPLMDIHYMGLEITFLAEAGGASVNRAGVGLLVRVDSKVIQKVVPLMEW